MQVYAQEIDPTFNPTDMGFGFGDGVNGSVNTFVIQSDGKIVIGGDFTSYNGTTRFRIARLNADGTLDTGFDPGTGVNSWVNALAIQSDGKILVGGNFTDYNGVTRNRIARLNADGTLDTGFDPGTGTNTVVLTIAVQSDGKILIGGGFTTYNGTGRNRIARLNADGTLDTGFNPGTGTNEQVATMAIQTDGKILIGGSFTTYNGTGRNRIARLNTDGTLDTGFNPGTGASGISVNTLIIQPDGKILIGGSFTTYNGTGRNRIARLNTDGTLDTGFDPGTGPSSPVFTLGIQPDGKVLIVGNFTSYNGTTRNRIARLNTDGTLDTGFDPGTGANSVVSVLAIQPDGKILIGGTFTSYNGITLRNIVRLNADATLDTAFNPGTGASNEVYTLAIQPDGKILIGGDFMRYNGVYRNRIARLNADGTLDTGFDPGAGADNTVNKIAVQTDGKILIGGAFTTYNGTSRSYIARLNADGSLDPLFNPGTVAGGSSVNALTLQSDGKILIGGDFTSYNGTSRRRIARLNADGTLDTGFDPGTGANNIVTAIAVQTDGKILIGGNFNNYNGTSRARIARLNADGSLDTGFDPGTGTNGRVRAIAVQTDGKILIGGEFTTHNGTLRNRIAGLNADGSRDTGFNPGTGANHPVLTLAILNDGRILIGGAFTSYNGTSRNSIARINADGTLDTGFDPGTGADNSVNALAVQTDGNILIGGTFTGYAGTGRNRVARIKAQLISQPPAPKDCGCVQNVVVSLDSACQFVLRSGVVSPGGCPGSTVRVMDSNPLNGDTIDCAGVWTYGLFNSAGTLICWGKVTAEDKRGPELLAWNGRCNSAGNAGAAPANGSAITPPFLDPSVVRRDTFLCMDIDQIYNVSASWTNTGYAYFAGAPTFQDACHNRRITSTTSGLSSGNTILCDCRTDVKVNDQITYYPCPLPTTVGWTGVWAQITRVFTATDCMGNQTTTTQTITFVRPPVTSLAAQVAAAGGSFRSVIGDGSKTRVFLDNNIASPDPRLMVIMDSTTCASETDAELVRRLRSWYYIFNDTLKCDNAARDDYAYFAEGASTDPRRPLLQCNYSFDTQIMSSYPVCDGNGKKVVVMTNYFDWCTGVKLPLDTITIKDYDNLPPVMTNTAKEQVVISTGPLDCTASFGIDRTSLLQFFGIDVQDNAGGCGIRDVSVKVESCVDSVSHGIIVAGRAWRSPQYQTVLTGGRRLVLGVPVGMHRLIVDATDMCYSQKRDTFYFRVEDKIAPVVKCTDQLNVTLSNTMGGAYGQSFTQVGTAIYGYARVLASQINAGTSDNCGIDWVRVRRALPANGTLGLTSYYESLRNDPRFIDNAPTGQINKGDGYDWNGNGAVDGFEERFHDTLLPVGSSTLTKSPFIMTPLLDWVDFFCSDYDQNVMIELWAKDVTRTLTTCLPLAPQPADGLTLATQPTSMTSGGNMNYCWMNVLIEDKVAPTFIRPWDVTAVCLDRAWLDTLALALSVGTLQLEVDNLSGAITSRTTGSNHAALYNYIESQILSKTANNASVTSYISGVSGKNNVANNKFTRLSGGDCGRIRLDVVVTRPNWHCDAGQYRLTYRPQKLVKDVWQTYDGPTSWPNTLLGGGNVTTITVEPVHAYDLRFPADVTGDCSNLRDTANVVDGGELGCDVLAVLVQDKRYNGATKDGAPVAECYKIFRTFTVVNWCQYDERCLEPMGDAVIVPRTATGGAVTVTVRDANRNKEEEYTYNGDAYTPARAGGNTSPSCAGSVSPVSGYKGRNNGPEFYSWMYTQYILVHDAIAPTLATTAPAGGWVGYQNKETCGGEIKLTFSSTDGCSATELQSGTSVAIERIWLNPNQNKNARVNVPNAQISPALSTLDGDNKTTQPTQNWTFEVTNATSQRAFSHALVPGQHSLTVVVRDDCGNVSRELDIPFTIRDTNGTAPLCINGLSTNLMLNPQTGKNEVTIWATDFKAPSEVWDCSGQGDLTDPVDINSPKRREMITNANYFVYMDTDPATAGFQNAAIGADGRPTASSGFPTSITITCDQLAAFTGNPPSGTRSVLVRVYTRDNASQFAGNTNNWAWCETFVSVDNATVCGGGSSTSAAIAGAVTTETNVKVEGVEVQLSGRSAMRYATDKQGSFSFNSLEKGYDYSVTPQLDKDYLNGVSTFDLVLIAKHILGQAPLNSPYKLIAADVNNSKTITTLDLIQLRKLVLNIDTKFANNTSWRFVDASFRFPNAANPWSTQFPEVANLNDLAVDVRANFIAIKVGDVNGNALGTSTVRTNGTFSLNAEDKSLKSGAEVRIPITATLAGMDGYQFTLGIDRNVAEIVDIEYGVMQSEHFGIFAKEGLITASWDARKAVVEEGEALFTLVLRAKADVSSLEEVLNINSRITAAEAYTKGGDYQSVTLKLGGRTSQTGGPMLYQNIPNPFAGETVIGFNLSQAGEAVLTVSDIQGRVLRVIRGEYGAGYQQVRLRSEELPAGVLQYTLTSGDFTATRRMVVGK